IFFYCILYLGNFITLEIEQITQGFAFKIEKAQEKDAASGYKYTGKKQEKNKVFLIVCTITSPHHLYLKTAAAIINKDKILLIDEILVG
ncbi:hypothetical protein ACJX0J_025704, partial [Zea mays]